MQIIIKKEMGTKEMKVGVGNERKETKGKKSATI
jgi:hypothetical protein